MNYKPDLLAAGQRLATLTLNYRMATQLGNYREAARTLALIIDEAQTAKPNAEQALQYEQVKASARLKAAQEYRKNEHAN